MDNSIFAKHTSGKYVTSSFSSQIVVENRFVDYRLQAETHRARFDNAARFFDFH